MEYSGFQFCKTKFLQLCIHGVSDKQHVDEVDSILSEHVIRVATGILKYLLNEEIDDAAEVTNMQWSIFFSVRIKLWN